MADDKVISIAAMREQLEEGAKIVSVNDVVKFKVEYPKDYKKTKHLVDGKAIDLHPETAEYFEKELKIGKIVK